MSGRYRVVLDDLTIDDVLSLSWSVARARTEWGPDAQYRPSRKVVGQLHREERRLWAQYRREQAEQRAARHQTALTVHQLLSTPEPEDR